MPPELYVCRNPTTLPTCYDASTLLHSGDSANTMRVSSPRIRCEFTQVSAEYDTEECLCSQQPRQTRILADAEASARYDVWLTAICLAHPRYVWLTRQGARCSSLSLYLPYCSGREEQSEAPSARLDTSALWVDAGQMMTTRMHTGTPKETMQQNSHRIRRLRIDQVVFFWFDSLHRPSTSSR